jgi:hypothetical protein
LVGRFTDKGQQSGTKVLLAATNNDFNEEELSVTAAFDIKRCDV